MGTVQNLPGPKGLERNVDVVFILCVCVCVPVMYSSMCAAFVALTTLINYLSKVLKCVLKLYYWALFAVQNLRSTWWLLLGPML